MAIPMATPWKHPKTGTYYFRKRVPADLVKRVGRPVAKESLGTKDGREAAKLFILVEGDYLRRWDELRAIPVEIAPRPVELTDRQVHAIAGERYFELIAEHGDNPRHWREWVDKLIAFQNALPLWMRETNSFDEPADDNADSEDDVFGDGIVEVERSPPKLVLRSRIYGSPRLFSRVWLGPWVDANLKKKTLAVDDETRQRLCMLAAQATYFAYKNLIERAKGNYAEDPNKNRFPALTGVPGLPGGPLPWEEVYAAFVIEAKQKPSTQKRAKGVLRRLFEFLGHDDLRRVTREDMGRWKDHNIRLGKANDTVRDADMAHPKALFRYAVESPLYKLDKDPTAGIRVRMPKKTKLREREFTDEEADQILSWSLVPCGPRTSTDRAAALRWVPWICAYHGARVNEITQLRDIDILPTRTKEAEGIWVLRITPEAGPVKDDEAREFALHPHIIEQGFLNYVRSRKGKRLFFDPSRARGGNGENPLNLKVGDFLANWVRKTVGVTDPNIGPSHAWRHLFRTRCRVAKVETEIIDALDGHAPATVGARYGSVPVGVTLDRISRLPKFDVEPAREGLQVPGAPNGLGSAGPRSRKGEANYGKRSPGRPLRAMAAK